MTDKPEEYVFRQLPRSYRRAGKDGAAFAVARSLGGSLGDLERVALQVMNSRFLEHLNDLGDAERLAALFQLAPWPEEGLEEFRTRVRLLAGIYLQGAATAGNMLKLLGAAFGLELIGKKPPSESDRYSTTGIYRRGQSNPKSLFTAKVVDLPLLSKHVPVTSPDYKWDIENSMYAIPPSIDAKGHYLEGTAPDPIIDIKAGSRPVVLPVIVHQDFRRLVLVNRFIPPGATLRVDLRKHRVYDLEGPSTLQGPVLYEGKPALDLLYGTGGLLSDGEAELLSGHTARPFHVLRWHESHPRNAVMPQVPGPPGSMDAVPDGGIPWPPMVTIGTSRWRLMRGVNMDGGTPDLIDALEHTQLRVVPQEAASGPAELHFWWKGRRLATFTVKFGEKLLWNVPGADEKEKDRLKQWTARRKEWLTEQIGRLKLAGVLYVDQSDCGRPVMPAPAKERAPHLSLWETIRPTVELVKSVQGAERKAVISETLMPMDSVMLKVGKPVALSDMVMLQDAVSVDVTGPVQVEWSEMLLVQDMVSVDVTGPIKLELTEKLLLHDNVTANAIDSGEKHHFIELSDMLLLTDSVELKVNDDR